MIVNLCNTLSENNTVGKKIITLAAAECTVKGDVSFINPTIIVAYNGNIKDINYAHIEEWGRYYFVRDKRGLTGGRYEIDLECDVLQSFADGIKKCPAILAETQTTGANKYLPCDGFVTNVKNTTTIVNFPNGLLDNGEFILITAGG